MTRRLLLAVLTLIPAPLAAAETLAELRAPAPAEARLRKDVSYLASPDLEGRGVTTRGIDLAAEYVAAEFKKAGLKPGGPGGSYFQPFGISGSALKKPARLVLYGPRGQQVSLKQGTHFEPLGLSASGRLVSAPAVFAGYGITSGDPKIDEYDGLDVAGKVVIVLRDTFRADNPHAVSANWRRRYGSMQEKVKNAEGRKAAAVLFVNDRDTAAAGDDLLPFGFHAPFPIATKLPILHVRRGVVEQMLGTNLEPLERDIDRAVAPRSAAVNGWTVSLEVDAERGPDAIPAKNVVGVLGGAGKLAVETVVVGAHYDHVGYGGSYSLSNLKRPVIHHGADDNASGTTAILEVARRLAAGPPADRRRLVFLAFSGEEINLLGSAYYCKKPLFPLESTAAMVNLDMVGRLDKDKMTGKDRLTVYGTGTAKTFDALVEELNKKYDFQLKKVPSGVGPSDQMSFYLKKIPVFFLFTNDHADYHRPSDTADKINVPGLRRVVDLTEEMVAHLATVPERPEYVAVKSASPGAGGPSGPRLGIRPDYGDDGEGVLLSGVTDGEPAAKGGLKEGDRIVEIGGKPVKSLEGYMALMRGYKRGDSLDVVAVRAGQKQTFKVKLD